jgi:hypothetical protein
VTNWRWSPLPSIAIPHPRRRSRCSKGRFVVSAKLPIPFDGFGTLEADLWRADAR